MARPIALLIALTACNGGFENLGPTDIPTDPGLGESDTDTDADADSDTDSDTDSDVDTNNPPSANAGVDQSAPVGTPISLDASASSDPDGDDLTFFWTMVQSPPGWGNSILNPGREQADFYADTPGTYEAEVIVEDGQYNSTDSVFITIDEPNDIPVANAGFDQNVDEDDPVSLDGTGSFDPEGSNVNYSWTIVNKPTASNATLTGASTASPSFTADAVGVFSIELIVDDGDNNSQPDVVRVTAASSGGFDTGNGTGTDCFGCVAANARFNSGSAAALPGFLLAPLFFVLARRREW